MNIIFEVLEFLARIYILGLVLTTSETILESESQGSYESVEEHETEMTKFNAGGEICGFYVKQQTHRNVA